MNGPGDDRVSLFVSIISLRFLEMVVCSWMLVTQIGSHACSIIDDDEEEEENEEEFIKSIQKHLYSPHVPLGSAPPVH